MIKLGFVTGRYVLACAVLLPQLSCKSDFDVHSKRKVEAVESDDNKIDDKNEASTDKKPVSDDKKGDGTNTGDKGTTDEGQEPGSSTQVTIHQPDGVSDSVAEGSATTYAVTFDATDSTGQVTVSLFYKTDNTGCDASGVMGWTSLASGITGTIGTTYNWDVSSLPANDYFICVKAVNQNSETVFTVSDAPVNINAAPTFAFVQPMDGDDRILAGGSFTITWNDADADSNAAISFYHKTVNTGACSDGTLIVSGVSEDAANSYVYTSQASDTSGTKYICARIDDGVNDPVEVHSGALDYYHECVWIGTANTVFTNAGNWTNCNSSIPGSRDIAAFSSSAANNANLTTSRQIYAIGGNDDGGTLVLNATLTLLGSSITSSVRVEGSAPPCSNCILTTSNTLFISNNATLTLGPNVSLLSTSSRSIRVGNGTSTGHLVVDGGGTSNEWPTISSNGASSAYFTGVVVTGVSAAQRSSINFNGVKIKKAWMDNDVISLGPYFDIAGFDNVELGYQESTNHSRKEGGFIRLSDCTGSVSVPTWNNISFLGTNQIGDPVRVSSTASSSFGTNVRADHAQCTSANGFGVTISGQGPSYGPVLEVDPNNIFSWDNGTTHTCVWTGASSTTWTDPANWNDCANGRGNYPDQNDWVIIPSAPLNQPELVAGIQHIYGFGLTGVDGDGGTVTLANDAQLKIINSSSSVNSSVEVMAQNANCTTCYLDSVTKLRILNNATLTVHSGITLRVGYKDANGIEVGDGSSGGGFATGVADADPLNWPLLTAFDTSRGGITLKGTVGQLAHFNINGLRSTSTHQSYSHLIMESGFSVDGLDNFIMDPRTTNDMRAPYIRVLACFAPTVINDQAWEGIDFVDAMGTGGSNIYISHCSGHTITVSDLVGGQNRGYGASYDIDADDVLQWQ